MSISLRQTIAQALIWVASRIYSKAPGFVYIRHLFGGWMVMDECLIRSSFQKKSRGLKDVTTMEYWTLPDEFCNALRWAKKNRVIK